MTILDFCEKYNNTTDQAKEDFLKRNLKVNNYIPFLEKETLAERVVNATSFGYENVEGEIVQTTNVEINTSARYILSIRAIIEAYTDLTVESSDFYKEYDALKVSGVLNVLFGTKDTEGVIPSNEIEEFYTLVNMKLDDVIRNNTSTQAFISNQVTRFGDLVGTTLNPILEKIAAEINGLDETKVEKLGKSFDKLLKKFK